MLELTLARQCRLPRYVVLKIEKRKFALFDRCAHPQVNENKKSGEFIAVMHYLGSFSLLEDRVCFVFN